LLSPGFLGTATADESAKNAVGLNFDISFEEMVWSETESGEFNLFLDYTIGANATGMSIGLYQSGCVTNYTSDDPIISDITVPVDNKDVDKNIYVDKRLLSVNNTELVTHDKSKGLSKGSLDFCIKAETWVGDTSAAFHKQNLKLTFDLSVNSFEVLDNDITTGVVPRPNPDPIVSTFKSAQCVCDGTQDTYGTPDSCDFGDDSYMNAKFLSFAKTDVFGVSPIIIGDVFTFTRTFNPNAVKYKYITLLRARFETDANGNNKFNGLELNIFGITCTDRRRLEIPHRQLATVYANLVVTDVLNFLSGDGFLSLDFTATATGDINGESATVLHAGSLELTFPNGPNAPPATPVIDGTVAENIIGLSVLTVDTSKYTVTACRCTETAYACSEGVLPAYSQNDMIYLCVQPNATVQDTVEVSNFFMEFKHGADVKYTPVTIGKDGRPKPDTLSLIQKEYPSYRVVSRLITALFDGGATKFDVAGNAYLEFKQNRRLHGRSLQDTPARAGESFFQMEVQFKKGVAPANDVTLTDSKSGWVLTSVGALIALSAAFLILKKMKK